MTDPRRAPMLAGGRNFRDLGGYRVGDGRRVKWGVAYRSGSLTGLTAEGVETLRSLGICSVCDLRTTRERAAKPYVWAAALGVNLWSRDYATSFAELRELMESDLATEEAAREAMLAGYRRLPFDQASAYAEVFRLLATGQAPLVFNCSAGKDRAGAGAALLLTALGVSREDVLADYVHGDRLLDLQAMNASPDKPDSLLARQSPRVARAILGCDPRYLAAALDVVAPDEDTFAAYLRDGLGVTSRALEALRDRLLE